MGGGEQKKPGTKVESYAQVPVLNQQQVVSVWKWTVPSHERWESQTVAVPVSDKGVYLVEATNGTLRAYTIIVVTEIAVITKAAPGRLMSFRGQSPQRRSHRRASWCACGSTRRKLRPKQPTSRDYWIPR